MKLTWRIWLLIICFIVSLFLVFNLFYFTTNGLMVKEVTSGLPASEQGILKGDIIQEINSKKISSIGDYVEILDSLQVEEKSMIVITNNGTFKYNSSTLDLTTENKTIISIYGNALLSGLKEGMIVEKINNYSLKDYSIEEIKQKIESKTKIDLVYSKCQIKLPLFKGNFKCISLEKKEIVFLSGKELGLTLTTISLTDLKTGLDLQGGARALLKPEKELTKEETDKVISVINNRLNTYGISDVVVRSSSDLSGNKYILIEMAGATPRELNELVSKQGKFEAKIGQNVIFIGGDNDITHVCTTDATCYRVESAKQKSDGSYYSAFSFSITLSPEAAKRQAEFTSYLSENISEGGKTYLNETLDLYLDDKLVDSLMISSDLKGEATTSISISGSGSGKTAQEAKLTAQESMKKLQTILITGSLPFKLEIVKLDTISPSLGKQFTENVLVASLAAFFGVCLIIYLRYRKFNLFIPVTITIISEAVLTLGLAVLINWNLDLASIAGIIAAIGTGVDDQIVMIDEAEHGGKEMSLKEKIKRAFTIIFGAYATVVASLLPLFWAGAGLLMGFALTTLLGITVGVFITRQAFSDILRMIETE